MARAAVKHNFGKKIDSLGAYTYDLLQIALVTIANAALGTTTKIHAAYTLDAAATLKTTAITNPDVPRNLTVTGNQAGVAGNVVITGTNIADEAITETIVANGAATIVGNKAFKTVDSITFPALVGAGDTVAVGTGAKLGLPYKLFSASQIHNTIFDGAAETLSASAVSATALESNTVTLTTALNGVKDIEIVVFVK